MPQQENSKLDDAYPQEWDDLTNRKVPKSEIDRYFLNFVARLLKEVKEGKRNEDDLGDGWSMVINLKEDEYSLNPEVYGFLFRLGDYGLEDTLGYGGSEYGEMLYTPEEVETELKKVAKKLKIKLEL